MVWLSIEALRKTYPGPIVALDDVSIAVGEGEFFAIVGPSNAGKSTLLKTIAGVELPDRGSMRLAGRDLAALEPRERRLSLLFQNIALFPNRTGYENIAFPMRVAKRPEAEIRSRVAEVAALQIDHLLGRLPRTFSAVSNSGGDRPGVPPADLLMLDEPLTNLDARIRIALRLPSRSCTATAVRPCSMSPMIRPKLCRWPTGLEFCTKGVSCRSAHQTRFIFGQLANLWRAS
jgi:multiple sugar transport system ATP-binding protein